MRSLLMCVLVRTGNGVFPSRSCSRLPKCVVFEFNRSLRLLFFTGADIRGSWRQRSRLPFCRQINPDLISSFVDRMDSYADGR